MKLGKRKAVVLAVASLLFAGAFYATVSAENPLARPGPGQGFHPPAPPSEPGAHLGRVLGLEPEKVDEIREADPSFHRDMRSLERRVTIERLKLAELIESDDADDAAIEEQFTAVGQLQVDIHQRLAKHVLAVRPLLDTEQRARFLGLLAGHFRDKPHPPGPGGREHGAHGPGGPHGPGRPCGPGGPGGPGVSHGPGGPGGPPMGPPSGPPR